MGPSHCDYEAATTSTFLSEVFFVTAGCNVKVLSARAWMSPLRTPRRARCWLRLGARENSGELGSIDYSRSVRPAWDCRSWPRRRLGYEEEVEASSRVRGLTRTRP